LCLSFFVFAPDVGNNPPACASYSSDTRNPHRQSHGYRAENIPSILRRNHEFVGTPYGNRFSWIAPDGIPAFHTTSAIADTLRGSQMRILKTLLCTSAILASLAVVPAVNAQLVVSIGVPPVCSWGYYDYAPYACAPVGFYGPGYFYGGIFLGMGPWAGWGYDHGWGGHRFSNGGGGSYRGNGGFAANRGFTQRASGHSAAGHAGSGGTHAVAHNNGAFHAAQSSHAVAAQHAQASHATATQHAQASHAPASHSSGGGESHGGGGEHH